MKPFWVQADPTLRLAIIPRPRGDDWLEDEVSHMRRAGIDVVVSMLQPDEADESGLRDEASLCAAGGVEFRSFPIADRETPSSTDAFADFIAELRTEMHAGRSVAVYCRASIGRSSLLLAALLTTEGYTPDEAFKLITAARGLQVPDTPDQIRWVERFAGRIERSQKLARTSRLLASDPAYAASRAGRRT